MLKAVWAVIAVLLLLPASLSFGQTSGTLLGTVQDDSGAVVVGATVTVKNVQQGTSQTTVTNQSGSYVVPFIPVGNYQVSVQKAGFQVSVSPVTEVNVDARVRLNFTLKPGNVQETVQVTTAPPLLRTDSADLGTVIGERSVQTLPLNGRNFAQLVYLVPGVTQGQQGENLSGASTFNPRASSDFNALGAQESTSAWLVDGISDNEFTFNTVMIQPSVESIQEFKVLTGAYSAEYGRGSGVVTTQTKAGSNQFHGEAFEFYRTSDLDARLYFNNYPQAKPAYIRNQFGATLGGPIKRNKAFFFLDYFGETQIQGVTFVNTVPTAQDRTGDFSDQSFTIYDPYSTTTNSSGQTVRTPISYNGKANVIPPSYMNPIGEVIANLYPLPTVPGALINNEDESFSNSLVDNGGNARVDYDLSGKDSMFVRYSYERYTTFVAKGNSGCCIRSTAAERQQYDLGPYISGGQNTVLLASGLAFNEAHVFSPTLVNQFIAGYAHYNPLTVQSDYGLDGASKLGISGINLSQATSGIPTITIGGAGNGASYTAINDGPGFLPSNPRDTTYQLEDDLSWTHGNHQVTTGYRILKDVVSPFSNSTTRGALNFQLNLTNDPVTGSGGSGLASLLMGLMANNTSPAASRGFYLNIPVVSTYEHDAYVQDDWKVRPDLTLNLGIRWDYYPFYVENNNELTNFDLNSLTLIYAGKNGVSRTGNVQNRHDDFGPRVGFSWEVPGTQSMVLRGGYAISYTPQQPSASQMLTENVPQTISQNSASLPLYPTAAQLTAEPVLGQPFAPPTPQSPTTTAGLIAINPSIVGMAFANQTPSYQSWSVNIEKQFAQNYMVQLAYVGSRSNHLLWDPNAQEIQPGPTSVPVADRITIPAIASVRSITYAKNVNFAKFEGMTAELQKRMSRGFQSLTSYTWSHSLDEGSSAANGGGYVGNPQTITDTRAGYGPSGYNIPQRFVESLVWDLPFGPGRAMLNNKSVAAYAFGGWEFDAIVTLQSGFPFTVGNMTSCPNNASNCWPDLIGNPHNFSSDPNGTKQTYANWYNPAAFAVPCQTAVSSTGACSQPAYRYGTAPRGVLRGPQTANFDLSTAKNFNVWEHMVLQFRLDAFDAFNHPVLGIPNTTINVNNPAGTNTAITSTQGDGRDLQGSLMLTF